VLTIWTMTNRLSAVNQTTSVQDGFHTWWLVGN
jgi:hypothetical protein